MNKGKCIVAMNIVDGTLDGYQIINTQGPLMYYWNDKIENFYDELKNKKVFTEYLMRKGILKNMDMYLCSSINAVLLYDSEEDNYSSVTVRIKDIYPFIPETGALYQNVFQEILPQLYKNVYNTSISQVELDNYKETFIKLINDSISLITKQTLYMNIRKLIKDRYPQIEQQYIDKFISYLQSI